jgi:hypothetical protein
VELTVLINIKRLKDWSARLVVAAVSPRKSESLKTHDELTDLSTGGAGEQRSLPSLLRLLYNYVVARYNDWKNKGKRVTLDHYQYRLEQCKKCTDYRSEDRCTHPDCGCFLSIKAWYASERCPHNNQWGEVPKDAIEQ